MYPFSAFTSKTSRLNIVFHSSPRCPAIFLPGSTLAGVVFIPVEPALLWARDVPWDAGRPEKFHLFITPANPLPLVFEITSTNCPGLK
ncbi:hypothetical protein OGATHE_002865 [Ogataea polymorpha]|uniref:Uncharacterized protein n=1 Tax=Ogataea polymorpha TaxID=460523 RepID=A0A9P8PDL7_9ASCO|nr:hypothetical protein OGATHE_002865 [Ogataea polymorpha]